MNSEKLVRRGEPKNEPRHNQAPCGEKAEPKGIKKTLQRTLTGVIWYETAVKMTKTADPDAQTPKFNF